MHWTGGYAKITPEDWSAVELVTMVSQSLLRIIVLINAKLLMHKN